MERLFSIQRRVGPPLILRASSPGYAVERAVRQGRDLSYCDFRGVNMSLCDLSHADFRHCDLRNANFRNCDLSGVQFQHTDLRGADFAFANCVRARFDNAQFANLLFARTRLMGAIFGGGEGLDRTRDDLWCVLNEYGLDAVESLRFSLYNGEFDGTRSAPLTTYLRSVTGSYEPLYMAPADLNRPAEKLFSSIGLGDAPENHPLCRLAVEWIDKWPPYPWKFAGQRLSTFKVPRRPRTSLLAMCA